MYSVKSCPPISTRTRSASGVSLTSDFTSAADISDGTKARHKTAGKINSKAFMGGVIGLRTHRSRVSFNPVQDATQQISDDHGNCQAASVTNGAFSLLKIHESACRNWREALILFTVRV